MTMIKKLFSLKMPKGYSFGIHVSVIILNLFGFLMVISANMGIDADSKKLLFVSVKEILFIIASYFLMTLVSRTFRPKWFKENFHKLLIGMFILLLIPLAFPSVSGAKAWIRLGGITIQPSEFAKVFIILTIALFFGDAPVKKNLNWKDYVKKPLTYVGLMFIIIAVFQSDFGTAVIFMFISFFSFIIVKNPKLNNFQMVLFAMFLFGIGIIIFADTPQGIAFFTKMPFVEPYMLKRFQTSANPLFNRTDGGFQVFNGLVALMQGGFTGKGFGNRLNKYVYIPEAQTDFILSIVVEEFGILGFFLIFALYSVIFLKLIQFALKANKEFDKIVLIGTLSYIVVHFIFNVGGLTALLPLTGVPLLFLSAGGSSRMAIMLAIGISQSIIVRIRRTESRTKQV